MYSTRWVLIVLAPLAVAYLGGSGDAKKIAGTWEVVSVADGGRVAPAEKFKDATLTFEKGKIIGTMEGKTKTIGTFKLDASKKPKHIDVTMKGDRSIKGIYELKGDNLKLCFNENPNGKRPTAFESKKDSPNDLYFVLKRKKK